MSGTPFTPPRFIPVNSSGRPYPGAKLYFYRAGTTTLATVYTNSALTVPSSNPLTANAAGMFDAVYLDPSVGNYKAVLQNSSSAQLWAEDNIPSSPALARESVGQALYPASQDEIDAGVTPTSYAYPWGHVARYGATESADATSAITTAFNVVQQAGKGEVDFGSGQYTVCSTTTAPLATLSGVTGLRVKSSGAKLTINRNFTTGQIYQLFQLSGCSNVTFEHLEVTSTYIPIGAARTDRGYEVLKLLEGCQDIHASFQVSNCRAGVMVRREASDPTSYSSKNLHFTIDATNCGYGLNCVLAGDDLTAHIRTDGVVRSYYPYGIKNHWVRVVSKNSDGNADCLLATASGYGLENIDLAYTNTESTQTDDSIRGVVISFADQTPAIIRNLKVNVYHALPSGKYRGNPFVVEKLDNTGAFDTTDRGHRLEGLDADIFIKSDTGSQISMYVCSTGTWGTGEYVSNVKLRFRNDGAGQPFITLPSLKDVALIENSYSSSQVNLTGSSSGRVLVLNSYASTWATTGQVFYVTGELTGSKTHDPSSLSDGAGETTTVTVTGAAMGDHASASFSLDLQGIQVTPWVSAANTVSVRFQNETGGPIDLGSGTLRASVRKVQ